MSSIFNATKSFMSVVIVATLILSAFLSAVGGNNVAYAAAPAGFADTLFADGLDTPTAMEFAPDGRLFVSEKGGTLRVIKDGILLQTPFASLSVNSEGERGLMGIAFDPNFVQNGYVYVYYTTSADPVHNKVSRLTVDPANLDRALAGSEHTILDLEPLTTEFHNAGALEFGKEDGKLYVSTGDNYYPYLAQSLSSRFGKILRINSDGTIPLDNPFYNIAGAYREIWALGLRNPFTFAFSSSTDGGKMHVNDVGQDGWEEINLGQRGANYGWPSCEGLCSDPQFADPVHSYPHPAGETGSSIAGGAFYAASQFPSEYQGSYFFGDYVGGFIKRLTPENQVVDFLTDINSPIDIEIGPAEDDGSLYYLSIGAGEVRKVQFTTRGNYQPTASASANQTSGMSPLAVTFDGSGSTDPNSEDTLTHRWDFGDGSPSVTGALVTHSYATDGPYTATLTVNDGKGSADSDTVEITVGNPPVGVIETPSAGTFYDAGDAISFSGSGSDIGDGALPASAFHWKVDFHHNTHTHPLQEFDRIRNGSFVIPTVGETDNDVWYRIYLTVTDSSGLAHESTRDILPNQSTIILASNVTSLELVLDGQPRMTPYTSAGVVGIQRTVEAPSTQVIGGQRHDFQSWSDGGERVHTIVIPESNATTTLTAYYSAGTAAILKTLEVQSADFEGNALTGHYTTITESSKNATMHTGYTPVNFTGYEGTSYTVSIRDYGNSTFDHWDDESANRVRTLTLNDNMVTTAYYRTVNATTDVRPGTSTTVPVPAPPSPSTHNLAISSSNLDGNFLAGNYIVIAESSSGVIVHAGYTPLNFTGTSDTSYVVTPQDDGDAVFDHWEDQSRDRTRSIVLNADTAIAAYYDKNIATTTTPTTNPPQDKGDESDEDNDDDDKSGDDNKKQKKEKKEKKGDDNDADDNDDDGGSSTPNGPTGSWLLPLEKRFEGLMQLIRSNSWWNA